MEKIREEGRATLHYSIAFVRWMLTAVFIGILCGAVGALFAMAVEWATETRMEHGWLLYLLPVGGLAIAGLYRLLRLPLSLGTDEIITTVRTQGRVPAQMAPAIFLSATVTHLLGGSAGREGAALQLGGSIGAAVGDLTHPKSDSRRIFELCGMAALFSALFGTPLTATIFVLEIIEVGRLNYRALLPCIASAVTAQLTARAMGAPLDSFPLASGLQAVNVLSVVQAAALGVACAVTAILFCVAMHKSSRLMRKWIPNDFLRVVTGGVAVIALTLLLGTRDYNGGGMGVIENALAGQALPAAFLLKILMTAITLGSGYKGGEIVPSFFVGATMGCAAASLVGFSPAVGAAVGMVGVFCGVTNAPVAAIMLSVELFGREYLPLFGVAAAVSFMLSGYYSLYHAQRFAQIKLGSDHKPPEE
ncbi:MAG: chloride channel protein [Aristaeellaceae bacterium]